MRTSTFRTDTVLPDPGTARLLSDCEWTIVRSALMSEAVALWSRAQEISVDGIVDDSVSPAADALVAEALLDELGSGARLAVVFSRGLAVTPEVQA